ncbi:MAG: DUF480 domain-containing protein [Sideroxyarcus sp.]|nr:DUF480 domain-containing protein [Sideroxyarcus sp.]
MVFDYGKHNNWFISRHAILRAVTQRKLTMPTTLPVLSLLETRVLGVLAEKQRTVPDSYPLTLNYLVSGCNQKSSRDPVIEASESEVLVALDSLRGLSLIVETSGGRASRYAHNIERVLHIPTQSTAFAGPVDVARPADGGGAAPQLRKAAQVRGYFLGRKFSG